MTPPSIKDVAKRSGVSYKTVSRVINGEPNVSAKTLERVEAAIAELGYRPHIAARNLRRGRTRAIRLIMNQRSDRFLSNPFQDEVVAGVVDSARQAGYAVMLQISRQDHGPEASEIGLWDSAVDGSILLDSRHPLLLEPALLASGRPAVVVANHDVDPALGWIDADFVEGGRRMVEYLIGLGHRRILHLTDIGELRTTQGRLEGYRLALAAAGIPFDPELVIYAGQYQHDGSAATEAALARSLDFTAIYCVNDLTALGAIDALQRHGRSVPVDVSVTGYDDIYLARFAKPALTTMRIPWYEMGEAATNAIVDCLEHPGSPPIARTFPMELVVRETTAPPSGTK